jgi:hypothetical protein
VTSVRQVLGTLTEWTGYLLTACCCCQQERRRVLSEKVSSSEKECLKRYDFWRNFPWLIQIDSEARV